MTGVYLCILFSSLWIHFILALDERTKQALIARILNSPSYGKVTEYRTQREKYIDNDKRRGQMCPLYNSTIEIDMCDGYFQFKGFAECVGCFFGVRTSECSLIIKSPGVLPMVVIVYVEQRITPGLLVYGDERSHNSSAMVITEPGYTLIRPKYNSLLVRLPADKWYHSDHRFGLWITEASSNDKAHTKSHCVQQLEMPATLIIPQWDKGSTKQLQCYWHVLHPENRTMNVSIRLSVCVPGDFDNCYLRYVKLYEGIGVNKKPIRIPSDFKTTRFELVTNAVVIRYFGWAAKSPILMKIDYRK